MQELNGTIDFLFTNNDYILIRSLDIALGTPVKAFLVIKENTWDADEAAIITKEITELESDDGLIYELEEEEESVVCTFNLSRTDTALLHPFFKYAYVIFYKTDENLYFTQEKGTLTPNDGASSLE